MNTNFSFTPADSANPVVFEQIFAEKPGGGLVANQTFDIKEGTAVGLSSGKYKPIKGYRTVAAALSNATSINIAKGSGIAVGDVIGVGAKGVACTAVDTTTHSDKDVVTVTLGVAVANDTVLYQAASASADEAAPIYTPEFVTGEAITANEGDKLVKLVNGANLRKETANVSSEVVALLKNINLV